MDPEIIPLSSPDWDAKNPAASFRAFADHIHGRARAMFMKDGFHAEMLFFLPLDGKGHIVLVRGGDRDRQAEWTKRHIAEHYTYGIVHVVEAWMRLAARPKDPVMRQIMDGEIKVSELREEDRKECLLVSAQTRDGHRTTWVNEILRDKGGGKPTLAPSLAFTDSEGRFGSLFG